MQARGRAPSVAGTTIAGCDADISVPFPNLNPSSAASGPPPLGQLRWLRVASPQAFYPLAGRMIPWLNSTAALLAVVGLTIGLLIVPTDPERGDVYRIVYVHAPAAWMSLVICIVMAMCSVTGLVLHERLPSMLASALAPTGALMAFIALWTGAMWGKPAWGAWWVWDARLMAELLLLVLYLALIVLQAASEDPRRSELAGAIIALAGAVTVPLTFYSVQAWSAPHQDLSVGVSHPSGITGLVLAGMIPMMAAACAYALSASLHRVRSLILEREKSAEWAQHLVRDGL